MKKLVAAMLVTLFVAGTAWAGLRTDRAVTMTLYPGAAATDTLAILSASGNTSNEPAKRYTFVALADTVRVLCSYTGASTGSFTIVLAPGTSFSATEDGMPPLDTLIVTPASTDAFFHAIVFFEK